MSLKIQTIASGSHGNCTYIASETTNLLVDAGVGIRRINEVLAENQIKLSDINGVLITHEHADHISGLRALADQGVPIYAHERIFAAISRKLGAIAFESVDFFDAGFNIGDILVRPFRTPHDSVYSVGYTFSNGTSKMGVATDIGHISEAIIANLSGCQLVLLEANHDMDMLIKGAYSQRLKQRIRGANGHLSNDSASIIVSRLIDCGLKRVILGHLSEENNYPELAFSTVLEAINRAGLCEGKDICVEIALQDKKGEIFQI